MTRIYKTKSTFEIVENVSMSWPARVYFNVEKEDARRYITVNGTRLRSRQIERLIQWLEEAMLRFES